MRQLKYPVCLDLISAQAFGQGEGPRVLSYIVDVFRPWDWKDICSLCVNPGECHLRGGDGLGGLVELLACYERNLLLLRRKHQTTE